MAGLLLTSLVAGCAGSGRTLAAPALDVAGSRRPDAPLPGTLYLPAGEGPFPVVILLHGCGGIGPSMQSWASRVNGWGYAAVILDSFAPRGVRNVCPNAKQPLVTPRDRAADVQSMAMYLRGVPGLDPDRIGVIGFSHGGATAAWETQAQYDEAFPGLLRAVVDYYGGCRSPASQGRVPLLVLAGEADNWGNPAQSCRRTAERTGAGGSVEVHTYPGVVHAFDGGLEGVRNLEGHLAAYNAPAAEDSFVRTRAFLDRYLRAGPG